MVYMVELNGKEYDMSNKKQREDYWNEKASNLLKGKRIVAVRYLNEEEKDGMAWMQASVAVFLDDGTQFFISQDDEGNGPGSIFGANTDGEQWTLPTV